MNRLFLLIMVLTSCAGSKPPTATGKYADVLPMQRGLVTYHTAIARSTLSPVAADVQTRSWVASAGQVLAMTEQKPISQKTDLVYSANIPARQVPNQNGDLIMLPPFRFFLTVNNQADSSMIWVTNVEVAVKSGRWEPLEKHQMGKDRQVTTLWLSDIDAMVSEMIDSLTAYVTGTK